MKTNERCQYDLEHREQAVPVPDVITADDLYAIYGAGSKARCAQYAPYLNEAMLRYGITTRNRIAAFIATIGVESARLQYVEERASGKAYEGRKDLGNAQPGDGVRFKGRGLIQLTGRYNYSKLSEAFGVDFLAVPELLCEPRYAALSAGWFWNVNHVNLLADDESWRMVRKRVNGGYNGYAEFIAFLQKGLKYFGQLNLSDSTPLKI